MPTRPATFRSRHAAPTDGRPGPRERGYTTEWDKASAYFRRLNPLCGYCDAGAFGEPRASLATRVDHLFPQRRWPALFWFQACWVGSCDECDAAKQALENGPVEALDTLAARLGRPTLAAALASASRG